MLINITGITVREDEIACSVAAPASQPGCDRQYRTAGIAQNRRHNAALPPILERRRSEAHLGRLKHTSAGKVG
jgi:hypothetical protein